MNIDIESIRQALGTFGATLILLKQAKDLLPENSQKQELNAAIESSERQLKVAELELARALGHEICTNHWPSGIMISADKKNWKCPICENEIDNTRKPAKWFV